MLPPHVGLNSECVTRLNSLGPVWEVNRVPRGERYLRPILWPNGEDEVPHAGLVSSVDLGGKRRGHPHRAFLNRLNLVRVQQGRLGSLPQRLRKVDSSTK